MKKVLIALVVVAVLGLVVFMLVMGDDQTNDKSDKSTKNSAEQQPEANPLDPNNYTDGAEIGKTIDATGEKEVSINIDDFVFGTTFLKIDKGTKVTWTNQGEVRHTVTSNDSSPQQGLDSELLTNGQNYEYTFDEAGLYEYFCSPHPTQMRGVVMVNA